MVTYLDVTRSITKKIIYDHPVEEVWQALTDAEAMSECLMPCDIMPIEGHRFEFKTKRYPGFDGIVSCQVLKVIPNAFLSFSWSGGSLENSIVTFKIRSLGQKTELEFEHCGFDGLLNAIIVRKILSRGWNHKILTIRLPKYLAK